MRLAFKVASFLAFIASITASIPTARAANCDRECLRGVITQYLNAMVAHNPGALKVYGGQIHAVEAFMRVMPANLGSGWD